MSGGQMSLYFTQSYIPVLYSPEMSTFGFFRISAFVTIVFIKSIKRLKHYVAHYEIVIRYTIEIKTLVF